MPGVTVEAGKNGGKVLISDESVARILDFLTAIFDKAALWSEQNPFLFVIVLLIALAAFWVWQKERTNQRTQKIEYRNKRERARIQLPLDLGNGGNKRSNGGGQ